MKDSGHDTINISGLRELGNKVCKPYYCHSFLPGESLQDIVRVWGNLKEPDKYPELERQNRGSGETKTRVLRVSERRKLHGERIPEICREAAESSYGSRPVHLFKENNLR